MGLDPEVIRRRIVRGSLAVILAMAILVTAGTIAFRILLPYRERVVDYAPRPAQHVAQSHTPGAGPSR